MKAVTAYTLLGGVAVMAGAEMVRRAQFVLSFPASRSESRPSINSGVTLAGTRGTR